MSPPDGITYAEAARILGVSTHTVARMVAEARLPSHAGSYHRRLSRAEVEAVALARWKRRPGTVSLYWADTGEAARVLGVSPGRVRQLADAGRMPCVRAPSGERLFRREQLEVVANARLSRRLRSG